MFLTRPHKGNCISVMACMNVSRVVDVWVCVWSGFRKAGLIYVSDLDFHSARIRLG